MRRLAPNVARWVGWMNTPAPNPGHFLPADALPETLRPIGGDDIAIQDFRFDCDGLP